MGRISAVIIIVVKREGANATTVADTIVLQYPWHVRKTFTSPV